MVDSEELFDLKKDANLSIEAGELKCLRFTKVNILADVAKIIFNGNR